MNFLKFLFVLSFTGSLLKAEDGRKPDSEEFGKIYEKFYFDLGKGDAGAIKSFILPINDFKLYIFGEALTRNPSGPFAISKITRIANPLNINEPFKRWAGCDVVQYQLLIVRYRYPEKHEKLIKSGGIFLESKMLDLEETYCDLWVFGSDGKWRVACDYFPGARVDCQSLGLMLSDSLEDSKKRQLEINQSRDQGLRAISGVK